MKSQKKLSSLSLFYPAYNEAGNIEEAVKQALHVLPQVAQKFEIVVINDGSTDATYQIAKRLSKKHSAVRVVTQKNRGYGGAVKRGFKTAKYDWVFFTDSDLQFNLEELKKFIRHTDANQMVLGYRKNRAEGLKRYYLAKALKIWNRVLLGFPRKIKDIDCAFKLIHKSVIVTVSPLYSDGAMVSTEFLLKAHKAGFDYMQVGVTHYTRRHGNPTGSNLKVIVKAVKDTFHLRMQLFQDQVVHAAHAVGIG